MGHHSDGTIQGAVIAIVFGAMLFALGMMPGLLTAFRDALRNFRDYFAPMRGPLRDFPSDLRDSGDLWRVLGGGVLMILGLVALLLK